MIALLVLCALGVQVPDPQGPVVPPTPPATAPLPDEFLTWLETVEKPSYRELASRFVAASGRDPASYEARMAQLARELLDAATDLSPEPARRAERLRQFVFIDRGFQADLDLERVDNLFPDSILTRRRGYCLGLSLVLLDLAERCGWAMAGISAPRHTFVRVLGDGYANLETTQGGEEHDDAWYMRHYGSRTGSSQNVIRVLGARELAAHLVNNHGFVLLHEGALAAAEAEFLRAHRLSPAVVEAVINLGVLRARQERFGEALEHFDAALASWPGDAVLRLNRARALHSLGRLGDAADALVGLLESHPDHPGLLDSVHQLEARLDVERDWPVVQRLVVARNRAGAARTGRSPGLLGTYYRDARLETAQLRRVDRDISFHWSWDSPAPKVPSDNFSVRWEGWLEIPQEDEYTFFLTLSDGVRLWVDGRQIVNAWSRANDNFTRGSVRLVRGLHDLRIDYFESVGEAGIALVLTAEHRQKALTLAEQIFHATGSE